MLNAIIITCESVQTVSATMGPRIEDLIARFNIQDSISQAALPYSRPKYQIAEEKEKIVENPEVRNEVPSTSEDSEEEDPLRISTRARFSYELDRYSKNAMLIFEGNATDIAFENHVEDAASQTEDICTKFKQTFQKFRFEVEVYKNLKDEEIASTCDRFFQRDFTEYGSVAVMMLAKTREGLVESSHTPNSEFGVMRYMSDMLPPTLQDKPKIYIVQTEGYYVIPRARVWSTLPRDNLEFRLPVPIVSSPDVRGKRSKVCCLLEHIHEKINNLADQSDLQTILQDAVNEFRSWELYDLPVGLYSSLTKELRLARTPEM